MNNLGARVFGLAVMMMGAAGLLWGDFAVDWMAVPATLRGRTVLAYAVGVVLLAGGAMMNLPRVNALGAGIVALVFAIGVTLLDLTRAAMHPLTFAYWSSSAEQIALVAAAAIAHVRAAPRHPFPVEPVGRAVFAVCLFLFGAAHFVYADFTATLVPKWLPPGQMFWVYVSGIAPIAAGVAILVGRLDLLAARLLTLLYIIFGIFVHAPLVWSAPGNHENWIEFILNLALVGAAWIVADSLAARRASRM